MFNETIIIIFMFSYNHVMYIIILLDLFEH